MKSAGRVFVAGAASLAALVSGCSAATHGTPSAATSRTHATSPAAPGSSAAPSSSAAAPEQAVVVRTPCDRNRQRKFVFVDLRRQHMWMCGGHRIARQTAITSGMLGTYTHTPTGSYHVQGLNRNSTLTLNTGATYPVKFWIPFDAPLFGFHDSSWQHFPYGSPKYKTNGSHGCVHMPLPAIRFLYHWADIGTPVRIKA